MDWVRGERIKRGMGQWAYYWHTAEGYRVVPDAGGRYTSHAPDGARLCTIKLSQVGAKQECENHYKQTQAPVTQFVANVPPTGLVTVAHDEDLDAPYPEEKQLGASASPLEEQLRDGRNDPVPGMTPHAPLPGSYVGPYHVGDDDEVP